ncbi:thioredoxin family protein [Prochlorococcus marinus]|uniref:thioredoxin family protein n=1 Tax=Prochlorococcus marinus TaxID=1219 RepID=UPI0022B5D39E|nr:thioredoxin family protein [Prochlorococcus marinus]
MELSIIKFSSDDCGTCHRMSHYDSKVVKELGLNFIDVVMQDVVQYRKYRKILISKYPNKEGMGWPTYLLVSNADSDFNIIGEIKGGMSKGDFRTKLKSLSEKIV